MTDKSVRRSKAEDEAQSRPTDRDAEASTLGEEVAAARAKADEYLCMAQRLQADFDNYRKRVQKENEEFRKAAADGMVRDLLPLIDDIDRALAAVTAEDELSAGFKAVRKNLMKMLESRGLEEIPTDGMFDPEVHEALCVVEGTEDGRIDQVFQRGYTMDGRIIRFAKVTVTRNEVKED